MNQRPVSGGADRAMNVVLWVFRDESEAATFLKRMPDERILPT